jgi:sigma-B regulation protein RsbU (phosphoserine phosphatase)
VSRDRLKRIHPAIDCHAYMVPCRDIGGDFYDVINLDTDHVAVVVGDVSGKGITAAMMMATCMTLLRAYCESFRAPSRIMRKINPRLIEGNEQDCLFTTLFLAILNLEKNSLTYCNAGHNPALLQRSDGSIEELDDVAS